MAKPLTTMILIKLIISFFTFAFLIAVEGAKKSPNELTREAQAIGYTKMLLALQAFNIRKKYELGRKYAILINRMDFSDRRPFHYQKEKPSEEYDKDPEMSFKIAGNLFNEYKLVGWNRIINQIKLSSLFDRQKSLLVAINNEDFDLFRRLIDEKLVPVKQDNLNYAIMKYRKIGSVALENIIDFMVAKNPEELESVPNMKNKLKTESDVQEICEAVRLNHYPKLGKALDNGLDPNLQCHHTGSILAMAVVSKCARCVEMLVQKGADVNDYITIDNNILYDGDISINPFNWTLLMSAVADAHERIISTLLKAGALVSKTAKGKENERFHARAVARLIKAERIRTPVLQMLIPSVHEQIILNRLIQAKNFWDCFNNDKEFEIVDAFLLLKPIMNYFPEIPRNMEIVTDQALKLIFLREFSFKKT